MGVPEWYDTCGSNLVWLYCGWMKIEPFLELHPCIIHAYNVQLASSLSFWNALAYIYWVAFLREFKKLFLYG